MVNHIIEYTELRHVVRLPVTDFTPMEAEHPGRMFTPEGHVTVTYRWNSNADGFPMEWRTSVEIGGPRIDSADLPAIPSRANVILWADRPDWIAQLVADHMPDHVTVHHPRLTVAEAEKEEGCWLESGRGWRISAEAVNLAAGYGFPLDADDRAIVAYYLEGDPSEALTLNGGETVSPDDIHEHVLGADGLVDHATDWLNDHIAPEGYRFGWHDGEFFLWTDVTWEEFDH